MLIYISNLKKPNHVYHSRQTNDKHLCPVLMICTKSNIFSHYKSCHYTIKECYFITVLLSFIIKIL